MAKRVAFLCVANSARSQMAEGLARHLFGGQLDVYSAGSHPTGVQPLAVAVLREVGIDIAAQVSKPMSAVDLPRMDLIVTLCADEVCPVVPAAVRRVHWPFPDPVATGLSPEALLARFRDVRDLIRSKLESSLLQAISNFLPSY